MGLFGPKTLPRTSYGYQPPPVATAHGWACANGDCGISEHEPVRRWPKACTTCGSPTDPLFDQPWEHEAEGTELRWLLRNHPERGDGFYRDKWEVWQFRDAALHGDTAGMSRVRAHARTYATERMVDSWWNPGGVFFQLVWIGLEARDLGGAADDLTYWISISSAEDVENDNANRTNCRQVIHMATRFLATPGGASHPREREIRQGCLKIAEGAFQELNRDQQAAVLQMAVHGPVELREFVEPRVGACDRISSEALARFGQYEFAGAEQSRVNPENAHRLIANLNELVYTQDPGDRAQLVAELRRHADRGEWEKVGAWKYLREFLTEDPEVQDLVDAALMAIQRMGVTNLSIHLGRIDASRYTELTGGPPSNDGFFGPPVFDSDFGPTRQYYFDHAIATAAARTVTRLRSAPGVEPGPVDDAARTMWDFGLLVYRGPLIVSPDIAFEPNVVRPAVTTAAGVDHSLFANRLADAALDPSAPIYGAWSSIGGARFIEDYLDPSAVDTPGYSRLLDSGLALLTQVGAIGVSFAPELLTSRQRERLIAISSDTKGFA